MGQHLYALSNVFLHSHTNEIEPIHVFLVTFKQLKQCRAITIVNVIRLSRIPSFAKNFLEHSVTS